MEQTAGRSVVKHAVGAAEAAVVLLAEAGDEARLKAADGDGTVFVVRQAETRVARVQFLVPTDLLAAVTRQREGREGRVAKEGRQFAKIRR